MVVSGKTDEEHLENLESVLKRLQDAGLKANNEKCEFFRDRVQFCGHEIDREGLHKTQEKIEAVVSAPRPENVSQLRSFLGLVNYYNRFLPNASTVLHPLHQLLEQNSEWQWFEQCEQAFTEAKRMITSEQVLTHYDPALPVRLACDASPTGIGAVLSHVMPGPIVKKTGPLMYEVQVAPGIIWRRHIDQLKPTAVEPDTVEVSQPEMVGGQGTTETRSLNCFSFFFLYFLFFLETVGYQTLLVD